MFKPHFFAAAATFLVLTACVPPPPVPPPRFKPNPPYPPEPVDPYRYDVSPPPNPEPPAPPTPGEYPTAQRTTNPDQVVSPYEPHNVIDVSGFKSGQLARDPLNKKIFRVP